VLFSDDLDMGAVAARRSPERIAAAALEAGCDMLVSCQSLEAAVRGMQGVERAVEGGQLDARQVAGSLLRINELRRRVAMRRRRRRQGGRLAWPAHARLARRLAG